MIIGYDAQTAYNSNELRNYGRFVIDTLSHLHPENAYRLYTSAIGPDHGMESISKRMNVELRLPLRKFDVQFPSLWRRKNIVNELLHDRVQLYHGLCGELPSGLRKRGIRSVFTLHDHPCFYHPELFSASERNSIMQKLQLICREADQVITVSNHTRLYALSDLHVDPYKISTIYQGCNPIFMSVASEESKDRARRNYCLPEKFILNTGLLEPCSNLISALSALFHLDESVHLVAVGQETPYVGQVKEFAEANGLSSRLHIRQNVAYEDLAAVYQSAAVFVYPSACEGLAMPIIEALCAGVPVVTSGGSSLTEAGGEAVVYVNYTDEQAIARAVKAIIVLRQKERSKIVMRGKKQALRFGENILAWSMMAMYQKVMDK